MVNTRDYLRYVRYNILPESAASALYMLALTYLVQAQAALGTQLLPVAELLVLVAGLLGTRYAFSGHKLGLYGTAVINLGSELVTLGMFSIMLLVGVPLTTAGVAFLAIRIINRIVIPAHTEVCSKYERTHLTTPGSRKVAEVLRERDQYYLTYWRIAGTSLGVLLFSILKVDLIVITIVCFVFISLVICTYQLRLVRKYLR